MTSKQAGAIYISLQLQTAKLQAGIASAQKSLKSLSNSAAQAGKSLSLAFTLPLAMIGRTAVKGFSEFDSAMTRSISIMGQAGKAMKSELVKGAEDIAKTTKYSATEAAEGYYFLAAAGMSAAAAIKALPVVARFATNANIGLAEASDKLVDTLNAVGLASQDPIKNMEGMIRVSNVLTRAAMDTNVSINDLAASLAGPLGGSMRANHVEIETVAAALEALGQQGVKAKVAGTALGIVIRELGLKAIKNADAFKANGIAVFDAQGKYRNFIDIMGDIDKRLKGVSDVERNDVLAQLGFTLKNIGFVTMFLNTTEKMKAWEAANKQANYEQKLFNENMKSFANQMAIVKNSLQIVSNQIGADLAPTLLSLGKTAVQVAEWFKGLPEETRKAIEVFGVFLAVAGPLAFVFGNLGSAILAFSSMIAPLVFSIGLIPAAFIAAGIAIYVFWDDIVAAASVALSWFQSNFPQLTLLLEAGWILVRDAAIYVWENLPEIASAAMSAIGSVVQGVVDFIAGYWQGVGTVVGVVWDGIKSVALFALGAIEAKFPGFTAAFSAVWNGVKGTAEVFFNWVLEKIEWLFSKIKALKNLLVGAAEEVVAAENSKLKSAKQQEDWGGIENDLRGAIAAQESASASAKDYAASQKLVNQAQAAWNSIAPTAQKYLNGIASGLKTAKQAAVETATVIRTQKSVETLKLEKEAVAKLAKEEKEREKAKKQAAKDAVREAKSQSKALEELRETLSKAQNKDNVDDIKESITEAIKNGVDEVTFQDLSKKLYDSVFKGYVDGAQDAIAKAGNTQEAKDLVNQTAAVKAQEAVDDTKAAQMKANTETALDKAEKDKAAYDDSVSHFRDIFSAAVDEGTYNFRDALKDIFVEIAAQFAASLQQALGGTANSKGNTIGGFLGGITDSIKGMLGMAPSQNADGTTGIGPVANGDVYGGNIGGMPGVQSGDYSGFLTAATSLLDAAATDKKNKSNEGTGGSIGAALGAYFGPIGSQIGQALGGAIGGMFKWGPQNPQTIARHAFANFIESEFAKMGQVSFFGKDGHLKNQKGSSFNFSEGMSDFNSKGSENSVSKLNALGKEARGTFLGLGMAMKETLGLTDAVGEQLGAMLADNLGGSVDNARLLFQQLGLSLEDMVEKLVQLGRSGSQSWLEIETAIQGVTNASMPGLQALADYKGAFQELVESGGRGVAALKGVKDIAQEGIEAGAKSLEELQQKMLASGLDPEQVNAFFDAVKNRGIQTLEELSKVSDRVGGGIVADMNANSASLATMWAEMGNQLNDIKQKIEQIPTDVVTNYKINVTTEVDSNGQKVLDGTGLGDNLPQNTPGTTVKHAKGGILTGPIGFGGNHVMGEVPEALIPIHRMGNGEMGVRMAGGKARGKGGVNIVVNAPYANPGTADHIRKTIIEMEPYLTGRAVNQTLKAARRGSGRNFR